MKRTTLLLIFLSAVCVNAEWKFDNDTDVQEKGDKRNEEREEARKALERVRFGVKGSIGFLGAFDGYVGEGGIMINTPLSRTKDGNLVLATELNLYGFRRDIHSNRSYNEYYLNFPFMFQYVSFFYPTSDIQVHWVPSPKRHFYMHFKTIAEAGAFIDIPLKTTFNGEDYKDMNFFDIGVMLGGAVQLESIILGIRGAVSYIDFAGWSLFPQVKMYLGYLF
jgi:hypothetical protein